MLTYYLIFVALSVLLAMDNYRLGLWLMLLVGLVADPVRRLTPGNPVFISVAFAAVFCVIYFKVVISQKREKRILDYFPQFKGPFHLFLFFLGINAIRPLLVNIGFLPFVLYSAAQYIGLFIAVQLGFYLVEKENDVTKYVKFYILTVMPFLFTVLLHFLGVRWPVLQTMGMGHFQFIQWHGGAPLIMKNGLFRNPEPMGWFAMVGVIFALFLLFKKREKLFWKIYCVFFSIFGTFCVLLSGRRKFLVGIAVFMLIFLILTIRKNVRRLASYLLVLAILLGAGWYCIGKIEKRDAYIGSGKSAFEVAVSEVKRRGIGSIYWALWRDGFWGRGLGTTAQGSWRFRTTPMVKGPGIEAGTGKIVSELGLPGVLVLLLLLWRYSRGIYGVLNKEIKRGMDPTNTIFLFSLVVMHFASFLVSHQIYADPLIGMLTGFTFGALLAASKWVKDEHG
jgi:hypothetical protein